MKEIRAELFSLKDDKYKDFSSKLMPTVDPDTVIGVRTPQLRELAKKLRHRDDISSFLHELPHKYYEENNLHAFLIEQISDFNECIDEINRFLPYVNNWATCDMMNPKCFKKNLNLLLAHVEIWLNSSDVYAVRFGIETLMKYYLDADFSPSYPERVSKIKSEEYYIKMMIAWFFATALAKHWDATIPYIEEARLPVWVHNKAIQKAVESYRITAEQKDYLKKMKIKSRAN